MQTFLYNPKHNRNKQFFSSISRPFTYLLSNKIHVSQQRNTRVHPKKPKIYMVLQFDWETWQVHTVLKKKKRKSTILKSAKLSENGSFQKA